MKLLIVDDDIDLAKTLKEELKRRFVVEITHTAQEGEALIYENDYDALILDLVLNGKSGIDLIKNLRNNNCNIPILVLTGRFEVQNKVASLNAGADDYLTKPFHIEELIARIYSLLRRSSNFLADKLLVGDLVIDYETRSVYRRGNSIKLTRTDFNLLEYLARNIGRVITRDMILNHVWESNSDSLTNIVDVHIKYLRDRIDKPYDKKMIKTVHGIGYKLEE